VLGKVFDSNSLSEQLEATNSSNALSLQLTRSVYERMIAHAAEVFPSEAIGLLGGVERRLQRGIPIRNVADSWHYLADPFEQFQALRQFHKENLEPLAVYHSHPYGGTELSAEDIYHARQLPYFQLVIAIGRPHNPAIEISAYKIIDETVKRVAMQVVVG